VLIGCSPYRKLISEEINALSPADIASGKFNKPIDVPEVMFGIDI